MSDKKISFDTFYNVVNGKTRGAEKHYQGINPSTEEKLWDAPVASDQDLEEAVAAGNAAFKTWSQTPIEERKKALKALSEAYISYHAELSELLQKENGKPKQFADGEVTYAKNWFDANAGYDLPEHVTQDDDTVKVVTRYSPLGLVAGICPWNYPIVLSIGKIAPALTAGCTILIKPSPFTPYTILKICEIAIGILPPGVLQVLGGDDMLGPKMVKHPKIAKISFTGSIATGKKIVEAAAGTLKRVSLELGGNDASIVCGDVDVQKVAREVAVGAFLNSGQICVATKRVYVHSSIYKEFIATMAAVAQSFNPGGDFLGPIQNSMQYEKVKSIYEDCAAQKYKFALGDGTVTHKSGYFCTPTIIDNPPESSRIVREEPFGPIVPVLAWDDEEDAIARANDSETGLGACVWSKDLERADRIARRLEAGSVWINSSEKPSPTAYFSGHKESGLGGEWGPMGLLGYCNAKSYHYYKAAA